MLYNRERRKFTAEEYLWLDEKSPIKSEFCDGEIFARSGGTLDHARILRNLLGYLDAALQGTRCEVFPSDLRLHVERFQLYTYPDIMVICGKAKLLKGRKDTVTDATLLIEVLSESTQAYDRTEKFQFYKGLPSFADYLLVHQNRICVEQGHRQGPNQWLMSEHADIEQELVLASIDTRLPIHAIYRGVKPTRISERR